MDTSANVSQRMPPIALLKMLYTSQQGEFIKPERRMIFELLPANAKVIALIAIMGRSSSIKFLKIGSVPNTVNDST